MQKIPIRSREELVEVIRTTINQDGFFADLNHLDVSLIEDFSHVFEGSAFNGDISQWDTSNAKNMSCLFKNTSFSGDISQWNTSNVTLMTSMFECSMFNGDLSQWDTSKVRSFSKMFKQSIFNQSISSWNVSQAREMFEMFAFSKFNQDISTWQFQLHYVGLLQCFKNSSYAHHLPRLPQTPLEAHSLMGVKGMLHHSRIAYEHLTEEWTLRLLIESQLPLQGEASISDKAFKTNAKPFLKQYVFPILEQTPVCHLHWLTVMALHENPKKYIVPVPKVDAATVQWVRNQRTILDSLGVEWGSYQAGVLLQGLYLQKNQCSQPLISSDLFAQAPT